MKFLNSINFDILNHVKFEIKEHKLLNMAEEAQIEAYGVGAAMPADVLDFSFTADNRSNFHLI